ncbi:MAG: tRNA dihydrouridine synthase DusB [Planctomycetes bacterium]|nr:tRNA dihydrouridine synthase DusB [Planctomycetota bacterium]
MQLGGLKVDPPVVLAPMAGVTNYPFRSVCREFGAGLYVSEMISARGYLNGHRLTRLLASSQPGERPRSVQIYATDPKDVSEMARSLVDSGVDHLDMNFGCPVPKVTRHGGGSAIPLKKKLLAKIVAAGVAGAGAVPFTIKVRKGIDDELLTFLDAGRIAQEEGAAAIGLHARTAAQLYSGEADWSAIAALKSSVSIPVLGNGDIWESFDALRMMRTTGCDGVIVGRGCLGRPWLFAELAAVFAGREPDVPPNLRRVVAIMEDHARRLIDFFGPEVGMRQMRKWCSWYTKGFRNSSVVRESLVRVASIEDMLAALRTLDLDEPFPMAALRAPRGKTGRQNSVALPHGYLATLDDDTPPDESAIGDDAESFEGSLSGG